MVIRNGGLLVEKFVALTNGRGHSTRSFSLNDLNTATNNYAPDREIYSDGFYIFFLYEGFLQDRQVMVKEYREYVFPEFCIGDIVFSSQLIMHKNVLKLLGCCLESSMPILVFEFAEKGRLHDYMYKSSRPNFQPLSWKIRLKIGVDVANVIAYLHNGFSRPIVHGRIGTDNIFLDEDYRAKVSDFSSSISIPEGETHVNHGSLKTFGYLVPEYATGSKFNEKVDVYSFGIVLLELLNVVDTDGRYNHEALSLKIRFKHSTGRDSYSNVRYCDLADVIKKHTENDRFEEIFDPIIIEEEAWPGKEQQSKAFLMLALHCTHKNPEERPEITDVGKQLRQMYQSLVSNCVHQH